jgi:hypothetical protein
MAGNYASGSYQGDHFFHNLPWLGQVHQEKTGMNQVKGSSRQTSRAGACMGDLYIPQ